MEANLIDTDFELDNQRYAFRDMLNFLFCDVAFSFVLLLFLLILDEFSDDKFKTL